MKRKTDLWHIQIFSRKQLLSAIYRATLAAANNELKTPNVHSEIVTGLSPSNNVRPGSLTVTCHHTTDRSK